MKYAEAIKLSHLILNVNDSLALFYLSPYYLAEQIFDDLSNHFNELNSINRQLINWLQMLLRVES